MRCDYRVEGIMRVRDTAVSRVLLVKLNGCFEQGMDQVKVEEHPEDKTLIIAIETSFDCSYTRIVAIEDALEEFGPYVTKVVCFASSCDGNEGEVWVGKKEDVHKAQRALLVREAQAAISLLTGKERKQLSLD